MVRITRQELDIISAIAGADNEFNRPGIARAAGWDPNSAYECFIRLNADVSHELAVVKGFAENQLIFL